MSLLASDLRFALRSFRRYALHSLATVAILGIGIGAVTLMFSVLNASVLRPLPFPEPDRLVWLWKANDQIQQNSVSYDDLRDYRASLDGFEDLAAYQLFSPRPLLSGPEGGIRVQGNQVTPNLFSVLGVSPAMGRGFRWDEAVEGGPAVTVLSHAFWQGQFGGAPDIVGRIINLDGRPTEVVGVMPEAFGFPRDNIQLWLPTREGEGATQGRGNNNFFVLGRLKDGVSLDVAQSQVDAVALQIQEANPEFADWYHWLQPLHTVLFGDTRSVLLVLLGIVTLVPLVACANVASLAMARATARTGELATRRALGAGRRRVVGQLVVENLLLALAGGTLGLALAWAGGSVLRSVGPASIPRLDEIGVDPTVLGFALLASLIAVPIFGVLPALRGTGFDLAGALRIGGTRGGSDQASGSRSILVVAQVALSLTLLITSGLLFRSFQRMNQVDPGFQTESLFTATIQLPGYKTPTREELALSWNLTLQRLEAVPGVQGVAAADWLPVTPGGGPWNNLSRPGRTDGENRGLVGGRRKFVTQDYFGVLGIPLLAGRTFQSSDGVGSPPVIILSETLAETLFPEEDPLGQPVILWDEPFEVVGVSASVDEAGLGNEGRPAFFISAHQFPQERFTVALRVDGPDALSVSGAVRAALMEQDLDITLQGVQTMEDRIAGTLTQPRFRAGIVGAFALVGLLLAAVGLYGVLAYFVTLRNREIGIRMAVGADRTAVVWLILGTGMRLVAIGVGVGLILGVTASLFLRGFLFDVAPADPLSLGGSTLVLVLVAMAAGLIPAIRAMRVNPLDALRGD